jgi:glycosyltransferase involved in cell wall biosynthesis
MRILIASPYLPWPIDSGGRAAVFSTLKCLEGDHQFTLVCPVYDEAGEANAASLRSQLPQVNLRTVFCGTRKESFYLRAAKWVVQRGRRLLRPRSSLSGGGAKRREPFYPFDSLPEEIILALQEEISKGVDLCQAEFVQMLSLGAWFPKHIPKLFIHHQVHFIYSQRTLEIDGRDAYLDYLDARWQVQEVAYLQQFDGIVTFSEEDRVALLPWVGAEKVFTSPFPLPADCGVAPDLPVQFDGRFLFMASEENVPNRDALEWFLADIWPEVLGQLPSSHLFVIGKWSESRKAKYSAPGVAFTGFVEDLAGTLRGGIMLAPLRIGSGLRVKIIAAMAQGVPVVSTSVGSEGLLVEDGKELLVRDDKSEFAAAAVQLARDPELWRQLAAASQVAAAKYYSPEGVRQRRNEIYRTLISASTDR